MATSQSIGVDGPSRRTERTEGPMELTPEQRRLPLAELAELLVVELGDTVPLADGRRLGYAEFGDPNGFPVLHFHGACGSRLEAALFSEAAAENGLRMIGVDRPGMGLSSPIEKPGYGWWPHDVRELADRLGLAEFAVAGQSGGGIYACVCGVDPALRGRLSAVILISGMLPATPAEKKDQLRNVSWLLDQAAHRPRLARMMVPMVRWQLVKGMRKGELPVMSNATELDRRIGRMPGVARVYGVMVQSGMSQGASHAVQDMAVFADELEFDLSKIGVPVRSFHGSTDRSVPLALARRVVAAVPDGRLTEFNDAGHSFAACFARDIMRSVAELWNGSDRP